MPNTFQPIDKEEVGIDLTPKQELFCNYYCKNLEFFCNATLSYAAAFGIDLDSYSKDDAVYADFDDEEEPDLDEEDGEKSKKKKKSRRDDYRPVITRSSYDRMYDNCSSNGSRLLRNDKIQAVTRKMFVEMLDNDVIDAELTKIIIRGQKDSDRINAIKEYNALKTRIIKKLDLTTNGKDIGGLEAKSDDELDAIIAASEARRKALAEGGPGSGGPGSDGSESGESQKDPGAPQVAEVHPVPVPGV